MDYQEIKKVALKTAKDVKKTSENLYYSAKLSVLISKKEDEIEDCLIEIGRLIYEAHCGCETAGEKVGHICEKIDIIHNEISGLKRKKEDFKTAKKCRVCGCTLHSGNTECPNCGCEL